MKLFLNGGGVNLPVLKEINKIIDHNKKILYIPLAWEKDTTYDSCYTFIKEELKDVNNSGIEMIKNAYEILDKNLNDYSFIFIGGGNTYKLLFELKESGAFEKIRNYLIKDDGIIYGASAGAVIFGKDINIVEPMDDNIVNIKDTSGFNMINGYSIFPHYTNKNKNFTDKENVILHNKYTNYIKKYSKELGPVIGLPEENTIYINGNKIDILGEYKHYYFN